MPVWNEHLRFTFGGDLGNPISEIWACSLRFKVYGQVDATIGSAPVTSEEIDAALPEMALPLKVWIASDGAKVCNMATVTWAKLAWINEDGRQRDVNTHQIDITAPNNGSANTIVPFYQTAAITLRTDKRRGRAHSGRFYPPMISSAIGGGGYIQPADAQGMGTAAVTLMNSLCTVLKTATGGDNSVHPVVASPASASGPDAGVALLQRVTGVVVDRVPDVQHRRTNSIPRAESALAAVVGAP